MSIQDKTLSSVEHDWYATRSGLSANAPLIDNKVAYLVSKGFGGVNKPFTQMEREWLAALSGSSSISKHELWANACGSLGVTPGNSLDETRFRFFTSVPTTSNELFKTRWINNSTLKAYYRFSTNALTTDSSGNSHTLTAISDPAETTGKFDGGVDLDGNDAYSAVDHADFKPTGNFTVGVWVKANSSATNRYIFQSYSQNTNIAGFRISLNTSDKAFFLSGNNTGTGVPNRGIVTGSTVVADGAWHFIVATWDGSYLRLYVDGVQEGGDSAWANAPVYAETNYVRVGCLNTTGTDGSFFTGQLDDVFLLNGIALSASDISLMYSV